MMVANNPFIRPYVLGGTLKFPWQIVRLLPCASKPRGVPSLKLTAKGLEKIWHLERTSSSSKHQFLGPFAVSFMECSSALEAPNFGLQEDGWRLGNQPTCRFPICAGVHSDISLAYVFQPQKGKTVQRHDASLSTASKSSQKTFLESMKFVGSMLDLAGSFCLAPFCV